MKKEIIIKAYIAVCYKGHRIVYLENKTKPIISKSKKECEREIYESVPSMFEAIAMPCTITYKQPKPIKK